MADRMPKPPPDEILEAASNKKEKRSKVKKGQRSKVKKGQRSQVIVLFACVTVC